MQKRDIYIIWTFCSLKCIVLFTLGPALVDKIEAVCSNSGDWHLMAEFNCVNETLVLAVSPILSTVIALIAHHIHY